MLGAFGALAGGPVQAAIQTVFLGPSVGDVFQGADVAPATEYRIDMNFDGSPDLTVRNNFRRELAASVDDLGRRRDFVSGSVLIDDVFAVGLPVVAGTTIDTSRVAKVDWQTLAANEFSSRLGLTTNLKGGLSVTPTSIGSNTLTGTTGEHLLVPFSIASAGAVGGYAFGWVDMDIGIASVYSAYSVRVNSFSYDPTGNAVVADRTYQALPFDDPDPLTPVLVPVVPGVPEPASIYLLAAGAAGLAAYRARRKPA